MVFFRRQSRGKDGTLAPAPLPQLLPRLDELLDRSGRGECAAVHNPAIAIGALVKVQDGGLAESGEAFI